MGHLDTKKYAEAIAHCTKCEAKAFEVGSYIERRVEVMLASPSQDGRWVHDDDKFVDGTYRIKCIACGTEPYASDDCPRCHRTGGLTAALSSTPRLPVPQRCPGCRGTELSLLAFVPARLRTGEGLLGAPAPTAQFGDAGFHIALIECDGCDWKAVAEGCPVCGGAGPLRDRP